MIVFFVKDASPAGLFSPSPTIEASPSIEKTITSLPAKGIGSCCDNNASDEKPLALLYTLVTKFDGNSPVLFVIVDIVFFSF